MARSCTSGNKKAGGEAGFFVIASILVEIAQAGFVALAPVRAAGHGPAAIIVAAASAIVAVIIVRVVDAGIIGEEPATAMPVVVMAFAASASISVVFSAT
jgi:hypothetical protein